MSLVLIYLCEKLAVVCCTDITGGYYKCSYNGVECKGKINKFTNLKHKG